MKIAISGSRRSKFTNPSVLEDVYKFFDENLKPGTVVILPGCPINRDSWVKDYLDSHQIKWEEYDPPDKLNLSARNTKMVKDSNEVWAFWTGEETPVGTLGIIRTAKELGKPFRFFTIKGDRLAELTTVPEDEVRISYERQNK